jgi:hypothetical protein
MWAPIVERAVEIALALISAVKSLAAAIREWRAVEAGEAQGRADSDATHAAAARQADERMRSIAEKPPSREEVVKRLEEGSA